MSHFWLLTQVVLCSSELVGCTAVKNYVFYFLLTELVGCIRLKIILGYLQLDNQLPLALMPVLLVPESIDTKHPVFKMTISMNNSSTDGTLVYPFVYARVRCPRESFIYLSIAEFHYFLF